MLEDYKQWCAELGTVNPFQTSTGTIFVEHLLGRAICASDKQDLVDLVSAMSAYFPLLLKLENQLRVEQNDTAALAIMIEALKSPGSVGRPKKVSKYTSSVPKKRGRRTAHSNLPEARAVRRIVDQAVASGRFKTRIEVLKEVAILLLKSWGKHTVGTQLDQLAHRLQKLDSTAKKNSGMGD